MGSIRRKLLLLALAFGCAVVAFLSHQYLTQAHKPRTSDIHKTVLQDSPERKHGYVLTHRFSGQQGAGVLALMSQR